MSKSKKKPGEFPVTGNLLTTESDRKKINQKKMKQRVQEEEQEEEKEDSTQTPKIANKTNKKNPSKFLRLFYITMGLVAPNLIFYSLINLCWVSFADNNDHGWVATGLFLTIVVLISSLVVYSIAINDALKQEKNDLFKSLISLASITRFVLIMFTIITLQKNQDLVLIFTFLTQGIFFACYWTCFSKLGQGPAKYTQLGFEIILGLLLLLIALTRVSPENRCEGVISKYLLPFLIVFLMY